MTADRTRKASKSPSRSTKQTSATKSTGQGSADDQSRKAPAKKAPAKKSGEKQTAARKSGAKQTAAKKSGAADRSPTRKASAPRTESRPPRSAAQVAHAAADELARLTGKTPEGVTGVEKVDEGWRVTVEVLEVRRIPQTTDVLAQYEIDTDDKGALSGYRRIGRYTRGAAGRD